MTRPVVLVVAGTRPEAIKLGPVVAAFRRDPRVRVVYLWTGQHQDEAMRPWDACPSWGAPDLVARWIGTEGETVRACYSLYFQAGLSTPAVVVVQGDTRSALVGALLREAVQGDGRPVLVHLEAGLRCWDERVPEERIRKMIDEVADVLLAPSPLAAGFAMLDARPGATVRVVGQTGLDALREVQRENARTSPGAGRLARAWADSIGLAPNDDDGWVLLTLHRADVDAAGVRRLVRLVLAATHDEDGGGPKVVWPVHPRHRATFADFGPTFWDGLPRADAARLVACDPIPYATMVDLLVGHDDYAPRLVATDSGGLCEDAREAWIPCAVLRDSTERWECLGDGAALVRPSWPGDAIVDALRRFDRAAHPFAPSATPPYGEGSSDPDYLLRPTALAVEAIVDAATRPERYLP